MPPRRRPVLLCAAALAAAAVAAVAGCSAATSTEPVSGPPAVPVPDTSTAGPGCLDAGPAPAAEAALGEVGDVDGDERPDTVWLAPATGGATTVGVATAAGGSSAISVRTAGPADPSVLVADTDADGRFELLLSDGLTVDLYAFESCQVVPVLDAAGSTYELRLGPGARSGFGCVGTGGSRDLVALGRDDVSGTQVAWTRTVVVLDGLLAREGPTGTGTYTLPADRAAVDRLSQVTCGDRTVTSSGATLTR